MQDKQGSHDGSEHGDAEDDESSLNLPGDENKQGTDYFDSSGEFAEPLAKTDLLEENDPRRAGIIGFELRGCEEEKDDEDRTADRPVRRGVPELQLAWSVLSLRS